MGTCALTCPYTEKTVVVESNAAGEGPVLYFQKGAWSPNRVYPSLRDARIAMLRRGKEWIPDNGQELTCPYTGATVAFIEVPNGVRPVGMYDPDRAYSSANEIYYAMGMRNGVPAPGTSPAPETATKGLEVRPEEDEVPFEIKQLEETSGRAKRDGIASAKEKVAPVIAEFAARRKK